MKKLFLMVIFLIGCASTTGTFKPDAVSLDYKQSWVNPANKNSSFHNITLTVVNTKIYDVKVKVSCRHSDKCFETSRIFGEVVVFVKAESSKSFVVSGLHDGGETDNSITCKIVSVE